MSGSGIKFEGVDLSPVDSKGGGALGPGSGEASAEHVGI